MLASDAEQVAFASSRVAGCTCRPDISVTTDAEGIQHARVAHDDWCPLIRKRDVN
jgi:hypothetical protein